MLTTGPHKTATSASDWLQLPAVDLLTVEPVQDDVEIESGLEQSDAFAVCDSIIILQL